jgi:integrase
MGAYTTLAINQDSYNRIIETVKDGYTGRNGIVVHRPAPHMACCLVIQANLGCRIGDILHLSLSSLVRDGDHYRLDIVEQKTGKARRHQVPEPVYNYIRAYCADNGINPERRIFQFSERAVQKALKAVTEYLDIPQTSTHNFRKFAGQQIYDNSGHDVEVTREFYQHSSLTVT